MKNVKRIQNIILFFPVLIVAITIATPALAAKTIKGDVPVLQPLQPAPENVKPNLSGSIQNGTPQTPPEQPADDAEALEVNPIEQAQDILPVPTPKANSVVAWALTVGFLILLGSGIGYWVHVHNKK